MNREKVTAAFLFLVALVYLLATLRIPSFEYVRYEPGRLYGNVLGVALLLASVLLFVRNDTRARRWQPDRRQLRTIAVLVTVIVAMLPVIRYLGLIVTFTIGSAGMSRYLGWRSWSTALLTYGAVNTGLFLLFSKLFGIYLPPGRLFEPLLSAMGG